MIANWYDFVPEGLLPPDPERPCMTYSAPGAAALNGARRELDLAELSDDTVVELVVLGIRFCGNAAAIRRHIFKA